MRVAIGVDGRAMTTYLGRTMTARWAGNTEVPLPTQLATDVRCAARAEFARDIRDCGIVSDMTFDVWPVRDVAAAAMATAIARFHEGRAAPAGVLKILPVNRDLPD